MTARSTAKRKVSPAELKRQAASSKVAVDNTALAIGQLTELVKQTLERTSALAQEVEELKQLPTRGQLLAKHDQAEAVINRVLREELHDESIPDRPTENLPPKLQEAQRLFSAKDHVVSRGYDHTVDTTNFEIGQYAERPMRSDGPVGESLAPLKLADEGVILEGKPYSKEKFEIEMFMQELVLVRLHDTTDETQIPIPEVSNNGQRQFFVRGQAQWVKRMYIEPLLRAKKTTYTQQKVRQDNGDEAYINIPHTALMYPFEVIKDSEKGKSWLRSILAEPY